MNKQIIISLIFVVFLTICGSALFAQDTFSIVAVDTLTGEVGSAGASCIGGAVVISDVHPGVGVIHSQSYYLAANQTYARGLMNLGLTPQQIIDSLVANDAQNDPSIRQYGVVDLTNGAAAYTGTNCFDVKNHIIGPNYAIQGNILIDQSVLDSMEVRFVNTPGDLCHKLMAALQGAKRPGADSRCLADSISSLSAFIRVARPGDVFPNLFLNLAVHNTTPPIDPIDNLQILFDLWKATVSVENGQEIEKWVVLFPNPVKERLNIQVSPEGKNLSIRFFDVLGKEILQNKELEPGENSIDISLLASGSYFVRISRGENQSFARLLRVEK